MTHKDLADLIFPNINKTVDDYEKMYPERDLPEGAIVTRFAPSPTGFIHMGSLLASFIERKAAKEAEEAARIAAEKEAMPNPNKGVKNPNTSKK